uniref:Putative secreted protein n=1 Tax=Ixodes ricinus TaxID=34613 RepID=A0A6B0UQE2_IXORI
MKLHFQNRRWKPILLIALSGEHIPDADAVVCRSTEQLVTVPTEAEGTDRVHVRTDDLGNASCQEVPDDNPTVVAANSQKRSTLVESTCDCQADAVQSSIKFLWVVLAKRFQQFKVHIPSNRVRTTIVE